jgi:uncharacterized protein YqeY
MSLTARIQNDLTTAMKERDKDRLDTLRMVKTALKNEEINSGAALDDEAAIKILQRLCKQRRDSIEQFEGGGRPELAARERLELEIIETYLPKGPDDGALRAAVEEVVAASGASSPKAMGMVMKEVMARFSGQTVDGKKLSQLVRERLGG